jgi:hypothetical protein
MPGAVMSSDWRRQGCSESRFSSHGENLLEEGEPPDPASKTLDDTTSSSYFDDVAGDLAESRRLMDAAAGGDPGVGLAAVVALRQLVEVLEELQVERARQQGWSWRDIASRLGVTKQAVHYKHGLRIRGKERL